LSDSQMKTSAIAGSSNGASPQLNGDRPSPRVALAHDYLLVMRGAEQTFSVMSEMWPDAPIYTLLYDDAGTNGCFRDRQVKTSQLRMHPRGYDVVVSSSSAFAHGFRTDPGAVHVCYCHTPFRYAWHDYARTVRQTGWLTRPFLSRALRRIREWDKRASRGVTHYVANSHLTRERIGDFWGREATVVHPPVDVEKFHTAEPEDYFLVVAELTGHKRVEVALQAAASVGRPIRVVGSGPDLRRLARIYGSTAQFLGRVPQAELCDLYAKARALVVANVEEFGIAAVEAQAAGRPVIGGTVGGTSETVVDGETGVLVTPENEGALAEAMSQVDFDRFSPERIRAHAAQFSVSAFKERFAASVANAVGKAAATR
jgi:glycosyltransferase involved in cell wall biosynthesis